MNQFLPVTKADLAERGWGEFDFLVITGDAYVDHLLWPGHYFRVLEAEGYRVAILAQPDWRKAGSFTALAARGWVFCSPAATSTPWWPTIPWPKSAAMTTPIPRAIGPACGPTGR